MSKTRLAPGILDLDCEAEVHRISLHLQRCLFRFKRRGYIIALSGGIDSSVTCALLVRAVGRERVFALHMPDRDSDDETLALSRLVANHFGIDSTLENLTPILESLGCYLRQAEAIRQVIPEFGLDWKMKIVLPRDLLNSKTLTFFSVVAQNPAGETKKKRLTLDAYLGIVAATNFKQRVRKMLEYYHADRLNYATTGTPNRLEYDQGFFVKLGDGSADVKPIAHLYKTQVYQMGEFLGVPESIRRRPPTTDTYSLPQGQDEFYFSLPYDKMDLCLYGKNHDLAAEDVGEALGLTADQVNRVYKDIETKRSTTQYLHLGPQLSGSVPQIQK